jgi:hypothetical protein
MDVRTAGTWTAKYKFSASVIRVNTEESCTLSVDDDNVRKTGVSLSNKLHIIFASTVADQGQVQWAVAIDRI